VLILDILDEVTSDVEKGLPADSTLARIYRAHPEYGSRDRSFFSGTTFSFFRWRGWLEAIRPLAEDRRQAIVFAHLLDVTTVHPTIALMAQEAGLPPDQLVPLGGLDLHAKSARLVQYARTTSPGEPGGKVSDHSRPTESPHPVGREWLSTRDLPASGAPVEYSGQAFVASNSLPSSLLAPDWVREVVRVPDRAAPDEFMAKVFNAFQSRPPTWLRAKPESRDRVLSILGEAGIEAIPHPRLATALAIPPGANLRGLAPRLGDLIEVQDLASQAVGTICAPAPGSSWWDACCGSGGKALHLANVMNGRGRILATDLRASTLDQLKRRMKSGPSFDVAARQWDGSASPAPEGSFDGVLLDAPCSGLGTWHRNPDARWRTPRERIGELAALQTRLLLKCASRVRPGGALVYATCTLTRTENEAVADAFTEGNAGFAPNRFTHPLDGTACAGQMWIRPWDGPCNGMFVARWTRSL